MDNAPNNDAIIALIHTEQVKVLCSSSDDGVGRLAHYCSRLFTQSFLCQAISKDNRVSETLVFTNLLAYNLPGSNYNRRQRRG
jgi:hypothetical protein